MARTPEEMTNEELLARYDVYASASQASATRAFDLKMELRTEILRRMGAEK